MSVTLYEHPALSFPILTPLPLLSPFHQLNREAYQTLVHALYRR